MYVCLLNMNMFTCKYFNFVLKVSKYACEYDWLMLKVIWVGISSQLHLANGKINSVIVNKV